MKSARRDMLLLLRKIINSTWYFAAVGDRAEIIAAAGRNNEFDKCNNRCKWLSGTSSQ